MCNYIKSNFHFLWALVYHFLETFGFLFKKKKKEQSMKGNTRIKKKIVYKRKTQLCSVKKISQELRVLTVWYVVDNKNLIKIPLILLQWRYIKHIKELMLRLEVYTENICSYSRTLTNWTNLNVDNSFKVNSCLK